SSTGSKHQSGDSTYGTSASKSGSSGTLDSAHLGASDPASGSASSSTQAGAPTGRDSTMRASSGKLGFMDRRFVTKAADDGKAEVALAQLAAQRATNSEVRSFAEKLVQDHTAVNAELMSIAGAKNVKLDQDDDKDRAHKRLSKQSGAEFDQEFVEHMIDQHEKDIKMFEKASNDAKDSDIRSFASKHVDHLREHLKQAEGLRAATMPTGRTTDTSGRATGNSTTDSRARPNSTFDSISDKNPSTTQPSTSGFDVPNTSAQSKRGNGR
ncbi:MAG TPA: DUF4142 domain-containing protein, partial [Opitutaceae bacterium]|nr:DUF4142 domain-containing protein [Opitutaceae bacterium]